MITPFSEIPLGTRFEFRGRRYQKLTAVVACDEDRCGNCFHADTPVVTDPVRTCSTASHLSPPAEKRPCRAPITQPRAPQTPALVTKPTHRRSPGDRIRFRYWIDDCAAAA